MTKPLPAPTPEEMQAVFALEIEATHDGQTFKVSDYDKIYIVINRWRHRKSFWALQAKVAMNDPDVDPRYSDLFDIAQEIWEKCK